jgi:hypothetical protein
MSEILDLPAVVNFREEARECVQLAKAEKHDALRTVLLGMALGYLRFDERAKSVDTTKLLPADAHPLDG